MKERKYTYGQKERKHGYIKERKHGYSFVYKLKQEEQEEEPLWLKQQREKEEERLSEEERMKKNAYMSCVYASMNF